jgi:membrane-bound serine protease (ClpP class)
MHVSLGLIIGVLVAVGVFLLFVAVSGMAFFGVAVPVEGSLAVTLFVVALILGLIFYAGVKAQFRRVKTGKEALIGAKGVATSDLQPRGEVRVMGEFWEATAKDVSIAAGQSVEVVSMDGVYLVVKLVEAAEQKA